MSYWYGTEPDADAITDPLERAKALLKVVRWICGCTAEKQTLAPVLRQIFWLEAFRT
jgi:hypothetical protein